MSWLRWQNAVDFVVLAAAIYILLQWARGTRALRVVLTILGLYTAARIAWQLDLTITGWLLDISSVLLVLMLLFFFQPELRHAFMRLDGLLGLGLRPAKTLEPGYEAVSETAFAMAAERVGALIVIARKDSLRELVSGGTSLGAEISAPIVSAIFRKDSPLHDGALIIEGGRISRAGVVLPLTHREDVPFRYGTRHRAAMGMAERCDALVVVVSEERGEVTLMHGLHTLQLGDVAELSNLLRTLTSLPKASLPSRLKRWCFADFRHKLAAAGIAAVLWAMSVFGTGATVRTVSVPIEFSGVPAGLDISAQSAARLEVQMRGASWLLASAGLTGLVARFNLTSARAGPVTLRVGAENLDLPPGVSVDSVRPEFITVRLVRRPARGTP